MSVIIKPEIKNDFEIKHQHNCAPGNRYVFVDKKLFQKSKFYIIGRRVEFVPAGRKDYVDMHGHNCNSFYFFVGDNEDLSGLRAEVAIEGNAKAIDSPCSVLIPKKALHSYKLIEGKGWFIHVVLKPDYNSSLFKGKVKKHKANFDGLYKKFEMQSARPQETERPIGTGTKELKNPQRYVLVKPELFDKAGIYAALHRINANIPFELNQQLHSNYEDEVYVFFSRTGESLQIDMFSSEKEKTRVNSPVTVYHQKGTLHKYDYASGSGFMFVILKERIPGEGYKYIPLKNSTVKRKPV